MFSKNSLDFKSFLKNNKKDILALVFLISFMVILSYFLLEKEMQMGVYYVRDVFFYLNNALDFAGFSSGLEASRGLSPVIPFLTSLIFRLGFVQDSAIMFVSTLLFCLSTIAMYAFLRLRFNELYSLSGAIVFSTFSINLAWASKGMLDVPALFFSILIVYFTYLAINKNPKYWFLVFPIFVLGFFTRYTVVLIMLIPLISVLTLNNPFKYIKNNLKKIFAGLSLGLLTSVPFFLYYYLNNIPLFFLTQTRAIASETATATGILVKTTPFYYLMNLPIFISTLRNPPYSIKPGAFQFFELRWHGGEPSIVSYLLLTILAIGIGIYFYKFLNKKDNILRLGKKNKGFFIKILIFLVAMFAFIITFYNISVVYSIILFSIAILSLYRLVYKSKIPHLKLDFLVFYWFMVNLIFFSSHLTKVGRYAITLTPAIAYFIVLAMYMIYKQFGNSEKFSESKIISKISNKSKSCNKLKLSNIFKIFNKSESYTKFKLSNIFKVSNKSKIILPLSLIIILISFTAFSFSDNPTTFDNQSHDDILDASNNGKIIANFLMNYDENYSSKVIWADRGGDFSFFLRMNISSVDKISNQTNFTEIMIDNNVSYFIANGKKDNIQSDYEIIKNEGRIFLYKRG
ncbi:MAG: glycosyltransferase family 39 protein [Methanobrevibacter sp.]|nr:glycosyltransferase family 39 protein [Methanobrevibacter sp.]